MRKRGANFHGKHRRDPSAWAHAIDMQHRLADDQITDLGIAVHTSIENLRTGIGSERDWHTLVAAVDVSLVLCERGAGREYLGDIQTAQDALVAILERQRRTGRWAFHGAGYVALTRAIEIHEAQVEAVSRRALRDAMLEVRRRMMRGEVLNEVGAEAA